MILSKTNYRIWLALGAMFLCLPMIFFDDIPVRDVVSRYAPLAEAFAAGDWTNAFHPRIPPLFSVLAGIVIRIFCTDAVIACRFVSAVFFSLTVFPFTALMEKVFNRKYAVWAGFMFILCSRLVRISGMGLRDSAKCFFIILASYGILLLYRRFSWKGALYCTLACAGMTLTRGDSLLFALLFLCTAFGLESRKAIPKISVCMCLLFFLLHAPWLAYEYKKTGWPVTEVRHAVILDSVFSTKPRAIKVSPIIEKKIITPQHKKNINNKNISLTSFLINLFKGFYPQYLILIIPVLFFRIRNKLIRAEEVILLLIVFIHTLGMILQILIADKYIFIYKRYLIVATPLLFGWGAIGLRWSIDKMKRILKLKRRYMVKFVLIFLAAIFVWDAWSRLRKSSLNPVLYKHFEYYTGVNLKK